MLGEGVGLREEEVDLVVEGVSRLESVYEGEEEVGAGEGDQLGWWGWRPGWQPRRSQWSRMARVEVGEG